jgi:predicted O-methyltransferase YrrM
MIALDIPWWNVASTRLVEAFLMDRPNANVWEYGSGASTIWLARRAGKVTSVEHDERWADKLRSRIAPFKNTTLLIAGFEVNDPTPSQPYVNSIDGSTEYDLIVVDGRLRTKCLDRALPYLKSDGIILFDDSGRQRYRAAIRKSGLKERRFFGLSYCVPYPDYTSVLTHLK